MGNKPSAEYQRAVPRALEKPLVAFAPDSGDAQFTYVAKQPLTLRVKEHRFSVSGSICVLLKSSGHCLTCVAM